jgi:predicted DNA repair protein MutK
MSGLLALLDDVAAIAKAAASSIDDVAAAAAKAGSKTAGVVIDDAAVTPSYVSGFEPERELPIIWRISVGSMRNKLIILLPIALLLANFLPQAITPLLMLGGAYLCFEGAEKVLHKFFPHAEDEAAASNAPVDPVHLEEEKVAGAIKTDFILSAEIMTIALAAIPEGTFWTEAAALALVGIGVTVLVYGTVAIIVKVDDVGMHLSQTSGVAAVQAFGRGLVRGMPYLLGLLSLVGTLAMLWVGGSIVIHGLHEFGLHWPYEPIHHLAELAGQASPAAPGFVTWFVTATLDGIFGLVFGLLLVPFATKVLMPLVAKVKGGSAGH